MFEERRGQRGAGVPREGGRPHPLFGGRGLRFHSSRPAPSGAQRCPAIARRQGWLLPAQRAGRRVGVLTLAPKCPLPAFPSDALSPRPLSVTPALWLSQGTFWKAKTKWEPCPHPALRSGGGALRGEPPSGWAERPRGHRPPGAPGCSGSELIFLTAWQP